MGLFDKLFKNKKSGLVLGAQVEGEAVALSEVSDPTFGEEIMGKGVAIKPTGNRIVAPCDATVDMMFETGHAVNLVSAEGGLEILIHVGLETVSLKGECFKTLKKDGDQVKKGEPLIEFDREGLIAKGFDTIVPMVICNSDDYASVTAQTGKKAEGDDVLTIEVK